MSDSSSEEIYATPARRERLASSAEGESSISNDEISSSFSNSSSNDEKKLSKLSTKEKEASLYAMGFNQLNPTQVEILQECIEKQSGGLSVPMGTGKTLISIVLSLFLTDKPILVVCSKSLIASWEHEIKKFFKKKLPYEVVHPLILKKNFQTWKPDPKTRIVLTTPDTLAKIYKDMRIEETFIRREYINNGIFINHYEKVNKPFMTNPFGGGLLYAITWGCLVVDEVQKYTNVDTAWCKSIATIHADYRWVLSGTIFDEPKVERILGYFLILDVEGVPRNLPAMKELVRNRAFKGLKSTLVKRIENPEFVPPKIVEEIISTPLGKEEEIIYQLMKEVLIQVRNKAETARLTGDAEDLKKFTVGKLVMIGYLRQSITCPLIPITSVAIDASDMKKKSEISQIIMNELKTLNIDPWLNSVDAPRSTRIDSILKKIADHPKDKIVIFSCFKTFQDILRYYLKKERRLRSDELDAKSATTSSEGVSRATGKDVGEREHFVMKSSMSMAARGELIEEFKNSNAGVLFLSYQLGAEGLNLQFSSVVMLADFWWNASKTKQAIARVFRFGQVHDKIYIYFFSSNTGVEKILFQKQKAKLLIIDELMEGAIKTKIPKIKVDEIIKLIELSENTSLLRGIKHV